MDDIKPVFKMICPDCKHAYNLPAKEVNNGFLKCPLCGYTQGESNEHN